MRLPKQPTPSFQDAEDLARTIDDDVAWETIIKELDRSEIPVENANALILP